MTIWLALYLSLSPGAGGDQAVMLDAAVLFEIEDGAPEVVAEVEIQGRGDQLVLLGQRLRRDLAGRRDNRRAADHAEPVLGPAFGGGQYPGRVLVGAGLQ